MVYAQNKRQQVWLHKHTIMQLTKLYSLFAKVEMTEEWAKKYPKIHFSVMHPGWADTPAVRSVFTPDLL